MKKRTDLKVNNFEEKVKISGAIWNVDLTKCDVNTGYPSYCNVSLETCLTDSFVSNKFCLSLNLWCLTNNMALGLQQNSFFKIVKNRCNSFLHIPVHNCFILFNFIIHVTFYCVCNFSFKVGFISCTLYIMVTDSGLYCHDASNIYKCPCI